MRSGVGGDLQIEFPFEFREGCHSVRRTSTAAARPTGERKNAFVAGLNRVHVVAAVHTVQGLGLAGELGPRDMDLVELRVDALADRLERVRLAASRLRVPVLLTVRHPAEGGAGGLSARRRRDLFMEFLPLASLVDVELRSIHSMRAIIPAARELGIAVVISDHHFGSMPTVSRMVERQRRAFEAGADVFKIAALTEDAAQLARLLEFAGRPGEGPRAMMGMGKFGQVSRLALACAGSVLNYGYLDRPNAPGQWEARELRKLLVRMGLSTGRAT
jgi:3-dehydroquinate dehydratase-1